MPPRWPFAAPPPCTIRRMNIKRFTLIIAAAAAALVAAVPVASADRDDQRPTNSEIRALFDRWNAALQTGDAEQVSDLYARDAVLLATVDNEPNDTRAEIVDYFENHFLPSKPVGRITESIVKVLDENSAIDMGTYEFRLTAADGTVSTVKARYTYAYERDDRGQWKIVHHHSSKYPKS